MTLITSFKRISFAVLGVLLVTAMVLSAAPGITISFQILTTAQDTYVQNTRIPKANTTLCSQFGLSANCTASQLTTAGCVALPANAITKGNRVYQNCTPFTQDAAGESAYAADLFAKSLLAGAAQDSDADSQTFCQAFKAASVATQNAICSNLGQANGCLACQ